jgi:hypothetical protein
MSDGSAARRPMRATACASLLEELRIALSLNDNQQPAAVNRALNSFKFEADTWRPFTHFSHNDYTRNLVVYEKNFSVLLLCWGRCAMIYMRRTLYGG